MKVLQVVKYFYNIIITNDELIDKCDEFDVAHPPDVINSNILCTLNIPVVLDHNTRSL